MTAITATDTPRRPLLIVVTGATASGKTSLAVDLAERLGCDIISADSRQIYRGMAIGTAQPTPAEQSRVHHHLTGVLDPAAYYNAARFESDALRLLADQWSRTPCAVVCGGSMLYVDALCDGIDALPDISPDVRGRVRRMLAEHGTDGLMAFLTNADPTYAAAVDSANTKRVCHAVEIILQSGRPYSELRTGTRAARPFDILKVAVDMPRDELFQRINRRVDAMMQAGLLDEARALYPLRHLNALNTVGYKELFAYFDGLMPLDTAVARIAKNTRVYAKKQLTWLARPAVRPAMPVQTADDVLRLIRQNHPHITI